MPPYISVLTKSKLFSGLSEEEILAALKCLNARTREYRKGQTLFYEGGESPVGVVLEGEVELQILDPKGNANIISRVFPSEIMGAAAYYSFAKGLPFDIVCMADCSVLFVDGVNLARQCQKACSFHAKIIENLLGIISDKNIKLIEKINILTKRTTREKLLSFLYSQAKKAKGERFSINLTRRQLADFLSVDRSAMIRELSSMKADGLIGFENNLFWFKTVR